MKHLISFFLLIGFTNLFAQGFNYKALLTDSNGHALSNQTIDVKFNIVDDLDDTIYAETHHLTTDVNGIFSASIGEGTTVTGDFGSIDWRMGLDYSLNTQIDLNDGNGYQDFGTEPIKAVPYTKYAEKALSFYSGNYQLLWNKPVTFYKNGTMDDPSDLNDAIYHLGNISIGTDNPDYTDAKLYIDYDGNNNSQIYGRYINFHMTSSGSGTYYGTYTLMNESGSGWHYGSFINMDNTATGSLISNYNKINNAFDGMHVGVYNDMDISGGGPEYAIFNKMMMETSATGMKAEIYNRIAGTSNITLYGIRNEIRPQGNGSHYAVYNYLGSTGSGDKYGTYNYIPTSAWGDHQYAVYGKALKTGDDIYAGYFEGNVKITGKLKASLTGNNDMKAYLYGHINTDGTIQASSGGFTILHVSTGHYQIAFNETGMSSSDYVVVATSYASSNPEVVTFVPDDSHFDIYIWNLSGNLQNSNFSFVVYKK